MLYEKVAVVAYSLSFAMLAYTLSRQKNVQAWLFWLLVVMALLISDKVEKLMGVAPSQFAKAVDLATSAVSTFLLAQAALTLMNKRGLWIKLGFLVGYAGQAYGVISHATGDDFTVYAAIDVTTCLLAGTMFGIALSTQFEKPVLANLALGFPMLWGFSDLFYWVAETLPVGGLAKLAMITGACGTCVMAALASHQATDKTSGPTKPKGPTAIGAVA